MPAMGKLRDSCNRCSASKIKCTKEKPTCARCARQGRPCEYSTTKRAGRKPGIRVAHPMTPRDTEERSMATTASPLSASPWSETYPETFSEALNIPTSESLHLQSPRLPSSDVDMPLLDLPDDFVVYNPGDLDNIDYCRQFPTSPFASQSITPPMGSSEPHLNLSEMVSRPATMESFISAQGRHLARAFSLFTDYSVSDIQAIMVENEHTTQVVNGLLQDGQGGDPYLIAALSVVILKVLARYAEVLRDMQTFEQGGGDRGCSHGHNIRQRILGQLHCVQRLVTILSKSPHPRQVHIAGPGCTAASRDIESLLPFPDAMLELFETDLRRRLRILSTEILDMLR